MTNAKFIVIGLVIAFILYKAYTRPAQTQLPFANTIPDQTQLPTHLKVEGNVGLDLFLTNHTPASTFNGSLTFIDCDIPPLFRKPSM
ncbi:MAG: hypothetical protein LVR00_00970 [Rhabdochlamydiaceae bacterium]